MEIVFRTDQGKVRSHNEDSVGAFENSHGNILAVVADGMGGHLAGEVASQMVVDYLEQNWQETGDFESPDIAENWLETHIHQVNKKVFQHAQENEECKGMGTTVVAVICTERFATIAHIGDSRCYMLNMAGMNQLTEDHSLVHELVKTGQISKEDAEHHPRKNVLLRVLGTEEKIEIDIKTIAFEENDMLLLCTDGLTNKVSDDQLQKILTDEKLLTEKADELITLANDNGGEDNITLAIVAHQSSKETEEAGDDSC